MSQQSSRGWMNARSVTHTRFLLYSIGKAQRDNTFIFSIGTLNKHWIRTQCLWATDLNDRYKPRLLHDLVFLVIQFSVLKAYQDLEQFGFEGYLTLTSKIKVLTFFLFKETNYFKAN